MFSKNYFYEFRGSNVYKKDGLFFKRIRRKGVSYNVDCNFLEEICKNNFDMLSEELELLDVIKEGRVVKLSSRIDIVIKVNILKGLRRRVNAHLGVKNSSGKYSLIDEFENLMALSHVEFVPKLYAFGKCNSFPMRKEVLIIERYQNAKTVDDAVLENPEIKEEVINNVFNLFLKAWDSGFAHMDPHPKNIMLLDDNNLKLIDLECCYLKPSDKEFYMGFSMGYFFYFWKSRPFNRQEYTKLAFEFVLDNCSGFDVDRFSMYYKRFVSDKVSRKLRYSLFEERSVRDNLIESLKSC